MLVANETNAYLHDGGTLASIDGSDDALYLLDDALGSVRGVTDEAGDLDGTADYDVYGEVRASSGVSTLFRFTGEQHDAETGFTYLRARYADPALGRFVSADSVQPNAPGTQGYNLYAYAGNNPTTWVDPSGHMAASLALGRFVLTMHLLDPTLIPRTISRCSSNAFCLTSVGMFTLSAVACAMDVFGCFLDAGEDAGLIGRFGSIGPSDRDWQFPDLWDLPGSWPDIPVLGDLFSGDGGGSSTPANTGSIGGSAGNPDPCDWLALSMCEIKFKDHVFEDKHNLSQLGSDEATQKQLIENAIRNGEGTIIDQWTISTERQGTAYIMRTTMNGQEVEIRFSVFSSGEVEVTSGFIVP